MVVDISATSCHIFGWTKKVNTEFNHSFKKYENIAENTDTNNTDIMKLVRVTPTNFP